MKTEIRYIERKTDSSDRGLAWIARVGFSQSRRTIYFNDMALKATKGGLVGGNHLDPKTGDVYWITGVKKQEWNRHWAGGGNIMIERTLHDWYVDFVNFNEMGFLEIIEDLPIPEVDQFHREENS
ncbi:MAG TPA: hypothetical protein EYQ50_07025 [Verrucomicrobiales bacterium]|nr:hypothetical protein [Verrucomicrobiales bacterium]HIL69525.1 hypothetical protein [Verrucomicrobiota bacterium]